MATIANIAKEIIWASRETIEKHPSIKAGVPYRTALAILREVRALAQDQRGTENAAKEVVRLSDYLGVESRHMRADGGGWYPSTVEVRRTCNSVEEDERTKWRKLTQKK